MNPETILPCNECGMPVKTGEYHPYAACLMFKACKDSKVVSDNLAAVQWHGFSTMRRPPADWSAAERDAQSQPSAPSPVPSQEPVAWIYEGPPGVRGVYLIRRMDIVADGKLKEIPLYAHPGIVRVDALERLEAEMRDMQTESSVYWADRLAEIIKARRTKT